MTPIRRIRAARPWLVLASGDFIYKGIMAVYWVLLARIMTTDGLGTIALANAIAMPAFVIIDAGLTAMLVRDYSEAGGLLRSHLTRVKNRIRLGVGMLLPLSAFGLLLGGDYQDALATGLISLAYFWDFIGQLMLSPSRSAAVMEPDASVRLVQSCGTVALTLVLIQLDLVSPGWIAAASAVAYLLALWPALSVWRSSQRWADHAPEHGPEDPEARPVAQGTILMSAFGRADSLIVQVILGPAALAAYTVAYKIVEVARLLPGALSRIVLARASDARVEEYDPRRHLYLGIAVSTLIGLFVAVAGPTMIGLLFGSDYQESAGTAIRIMGLSTVPFAILSLGTMYAVGSGRSARYRRIAAESLAFLVVSVSILTAWLGLEGAAIGMLVSQIFAAWKFWRVMHPGPGELAGTRA